MNQEFAAIEPGQVALVTAGASGIGRCIAEALLAHGCQVHVCDMDPAVLEEFLQDHPQASATLADVADPAQVEQLFADLKARYGQLNILVNNAGIAGPTAAVEDIAPDEWQETVNVNLSGQFYVTRQAVPMLKEGGGGSIINISSNAALFGTPLRSPYAASKWALIGLTKTWAMELGDCNIRVNALCPGSVNGPRIERVISEEARKRGVCPESLRGVYQRQSSMRRFVDAQDIANMALFLASDLGATISGQAIGIDGHTEGLSNWLN